MNADGRLPPRQRRRLVDPADLTTARITLSIEAASIDTGIGMRDNHLRSADFFDVERFPTWPRSRACGWRPPARRATVVGRLTLHGVTREIAVPSTCTLTDVALVASRRARREPPRLRHHLQSFVNPIGNEVRVASPSAPAGPEEIRHGRRAPARRSCRPLLGLHDPARRRRRSARPRPPASPASSGPAPPGARTGSRPPRARVFYTEAADHYNCPVGSYTHGVELPAERAAELEGVVGTMVGLQYIRMEEVPRDAAPDRALRRRGVRPAGPGAERRPTSCWCAARARQIMLVAEAARAAGIAHDGAVLGRPACAMIPEAMRAAPATPASAASATASTPAWATTSCTSRSRAPRLADIVARLETVANANRELEKYHEERRATV